MISVFTRIQPVTYSGVKLMATAKVTNVTCATVSDFLSGKSGNKEDTYEEKLKKRKPPVECSTFNSSQQLHDMYKDTVKNTEPNPAKVKAMEEFMSHLVKQNSKHDSNVAVAKVSELGLKRRPSMLGHMVHDDTGEVQNDA
ncbi:hypothetical protein ACF0H5_012330 [Mactra antiquata]